MKKIYQTPQINKLVCCGNSSILAASEPLIDGFIDDGGSGTTIIDGGDGSGTDDPGAKKFNLWDDWD